MTTDQIGRKAGERLKALREKRPLIHNITNHVVMNYTANALLASGASPVMAHAREEVEEMVSLAGALVLNIGTLTSPWVEAMLLAGKRANELNIPVILDPVGSGATRFRTDSATRLLRELSIHVVRGNASEILSLVESESRTKGVDAIHKVDEVRDAALQLAKTLGTTLAITGPVDLTTDGERIVQISNGHELMGTVTGTGCTASALVGAFCAVETDPVDAAASALAYFGLAGEMAASSAQGPGTFQMALLDALFNIDSPRLEKGAKIKN
ncbi:MAG: hydroxyethylthiazole kinase [Deltaproteobacteria bacterium]|nr:hydroxyethylthiazole kinase [Deltaproteobacteria bacterium]